MGDMSRPRRVGRACPVSSDVAGQTGAHAHSCRSATELAHCLAARDMLILHAKARTYGGYVQASACGEGMSSGEPPSCNENQRGATAASPLLKMDRK